jgi:DNA-binding response OmpR family regulator
LTNITPKKILVMDDDPDIALALLAMLEDAGYDVRTLDRREELEQALSSNQPDLILLDMLLSGLDGREIVRQLKRQETTSHIPIMMISAHPDAEEEARGAGADDFLPKPFDLDELLEKVAICLN